MAAKTDIFGYTRNPKPENVFSSSGSLLKFGASPSGGDAKAEDLIGNLIQNWNISYNNNITEIFELGSDQIYWAQGRPTGTGSIARIVGLGKTELFPKEAMNVCLGGALIQIEARPNLCPDKGGDKNAAGRKAKGIVLEMDGCIVTSIGFSAGVADTRINENIGFRFSTLQINPGRTSV